MPDKCQILLYTTYLHIIGGIETFVFNFIDLMSEYDIALMSAQALPPEIIPRLKGIKVFQGVRDVECDTLIVLRMDIPIPSYIKYNKSVRMCHAMRFKPDLEIKRDCDFIVHVSEASKESFESDGLVIHNPLIKSKGEPLFLVSATRIPATDKGRNRDRLLILARMLDKAGIPFIWLNFSDKPIDNAPKGLVNVGTVADCQPYIAKADYLVQLSDFEGFGYTVLEALVNNTAVICTPFETTGELGVVDGVNAHIVPFDMNFDPHILLDVPKFEYKWDNQSIKKKWKKIVGKAKPKPKVEAIKEEPTKIVRAVRRYMDLRLDRWVYPDEILTMTESRIDEIRQTEEKTGHQFIEVIDGVR